MSDKDQRKAASKPDEALRVVFDPSKTEHQQLADVSLSPLTRGGVSARAWASHSMGETGINEAVSFVTDQANKAAAGDLTAAKAMLMAQAVTLDTVFNEMVRRASGLIRTKPDGSWSISAESLDALMRTGMKAQNQCRATLQTLGELVNPRSVAFIKQAPGSQANVAAGAQQVQNGVMSGQPGGQDSTHAENGAGRANKLLEANPSERLDIGAQAAAGGANQVLEAVGTVDRAPHGGGKVRSLSKRAKTRSAER